MADSPLRWVTPGLLRPGDPAPPRGRLLSWTDQLIGFPRVTVRQNGRVISTKRLPWPASPGRVFGIPASMLTGFDATGGDVTIGITGRQHAACPSGRPALRVAHSS